MQTYKGEQSNESSVHTVEWKESVFKSISFWSMRCIFSELAPSKTHFQGEIYKIAVSNCEPRTTLIYLDSVKCRQTNGDNQLNHYAQRNGKKRQFKSISFRSIRSILHILRAPSKTHFQDESYCRKLLLSIFLSYIGRHLQKPSYEPRVTRL